MRREIGTSALILFLAAVSLRATTVSGAVRDAAGTAVTGRIEFELSAPGTVSDPALIVQYPKRTCAITAGMVAAGCTVPGNETITPAGTTYRVRIISSDGRELLRKKSCLITTAAWSVTSLAGCQ